MSHESKLIIIRGNSGSGKSTVAKALRSVNTAGIWVCMSFSMESSIAGNTVRC